MPRTTTARLAIGALAAAIALVAVAGWLVFGRSTRHQAPAAPTIPDRAALELGHPGHIHFVDEQTGWRLDANTADFMNRTGRISRTNDGGRSWSKQLEWKGDPARGARFFSATEGIVAAYTDPYAADGGTLSVFTTRDGLTWQQQQGPKHVPWDGISFTSLDEGWAANPIGNPGAGLEILHTTDSGQHWSHAGTLAAGGNRPDYTRLVLADRRNGWVTGTTSDGQPLIWVTHDAGVNWALTRLPLYPGWSEISAVKPSGPNQAFVAVSPPNRDDAVLFYTSDGGDSWTGPRQIARGGIGVVDSRQLWVGGSTLWHSSDGGRNWLDLHPDLPNLPASYINPETNFNDFAFAGSTRMWAVLTQKERCNDWAQRPYLHVKGWPLCGDDHQRSRQLFIGSSDGGRTWTELG